MPYLYKVTPDKGLYCDEDSDKSFEDQKVN